MSVNKVLLVGYVGNDPTTKQFEDGGSATNFSVATNKKWKGKDGEQKESTTWHNISCYGKLAEITSQYLKKSRQVFIEGEIRTRTYDKDGETRYATEVIAERVEFLGNSKETGETTTTAAKTTTTPPTRPNVKNYAPTTATDDTGF